MKDSIITDTRSILKKSIRALKNDDIKALRDLSNDAIQNVLLYQEKFSLELAIIVYTLAKIFQNPRYAKDVEKSKKAFEKELINIDISLRNDDGGSYNNSLKRIFGLLENLDESVNIHIDEVLESTKVKKGSSLYNHGVSLGRSAKLLGVSQWDLMNYLGNTKLDDYSEDKKKLYERILYAKKIFNLK